MPNLYDEYDVAGKEVSSTYEGRHVTFLESYLVHPTHTDGFVDKGDPVVAGNIVGVALGSAAAATDQIALDTEGIWALSVVGTDDEGNSAVARGDVIYINRTTGVLSKISSHTTNVPFGIALMTMDDGATDVIAVKVHWNMWMDIYRDYIAGGAAENALLIDVDDATTLATGYGQGLQITYNNTGDKTGDAEVHNIGADLSLTGDVPYAYNYTAYIAASGNPTIGQVAGLSIYFDEMGTAIGARTPIDVGKVSTNGAVGRDTFMRVREHGTVLGDSVFLLEGGNNLGCATYLLDMQNGGGAALPFILAAVGGNQTAKIAVRWNAVDYFIPLHTA